MTLEEIKSGQTKVETELPIPKIEDRLEPPKETAPEPKGDENQIHNHNKNHNSSRSTKISR